jgi:transcriptional regulator with XRE-family HTH domain
MSEPQIRPTCQTAGRTRHEAELVNFGGWLRTQLERRGWSRHYFAQSAGIITSTVYKWTNNEQRPSPKHCVIIADALGVDLDLVLAAAGHRLRDDVAPGVVRAEIAALLGRVPEELLVVLAPMLRALTDASTQVETLKRLRDRLAHAHPAEQAGP